MSFLKQFSRMRLLKILIYSSCFFTLIISCVKTQIWTRKRRWCKSNFTTKLWWINGIIS